MIAFRKVAALAGAVAATVMVLSTIRATSEEAASLFDLAEQKRWEGDYPAARALHGRSLALRETTPATDPHDLVQSLRGLGNVHFKVAEYAEARSLADRALAIAESSFGPDDPELAEALVDVARVMRATGDYVSGRPLLDRALAIQETGHGPDSLQTAYALRELGEVLRLLGDYGAARPAFERALATRERVLGPDHLEVADVLSGMGVLLRRIGIRRSRAAPEAFPVCERALAIAERTLGPNHPELAPYLEGMGWAIIQRHGLVEAGREARPYFERALAIWDRTMGPDHLACVDSLEGLANTANLLGRLDVALEMRRKKVAIERAGLGPDNVMVGFSLTQLAYAENAVRIAMPPETRAEMAHAVREVVDHALEADRINREHARTIGRFLPENEALSVVSTRWTHGLDLAIGHAISGGDAEVRRRTWDALVRSRALALDTLASRHAVEVRTTDPEVERLAADVESARARLASVTVRDREQDPRARRIAIDEALGEKQRAERAFAARSAALAQQRERSSVGLERVMASLPPSSALVAYITSWDSDAYVAFVVRSGESAPAVVRLGAAEEIDRLVGEWRRLLTKAPEEVGAEARARAAGERLRHRIWDPLRAHVAHARRVFVVPDGSLNAVSFSALPSGPDRYLVEDGPILHYLSAERDLVPLEEPRRGEGLLVVGGPNYDDTSPEPVAPVVASGRTYRGSRSSCESFQRMRFAPLPESDKEARRLVEIWSAARQAPAQRLGGEAASEAAFKRLAPGRRVLHLATHAFLLGGACGSPNDTTPWIAGEDPLLLSGLALAGANHRDTAGPNDEDGILTAEEIAALDLSGVEWAVLSACDTASGDFRMGEGVLGLQRAFRIAGARTLVMSLWPVDDRETRHFMEELYERRLRRGLDTAQAVRGAMLSVLADRRLKGLDTHPFHWAGFLASGDWR